MPVDPYLWKICREDRESLSIGLSLTRSPKPDVVEMGRRLVALARRSLRRRTREWHRLEREHVADLGYLDLGGEAADLTLENAGPVIVSEFRTLTPAWADAYRRSMPKRTVSDIAREIFSLWRPVDPGARPYLEAMLSMDYSSFIHPDSPTTERMYGAEPARDVVERFLSNASTFRGEDARRVKLELRQLVGRRT